jgi:hypothetical protein
MLRTSNLTRWWVLRCKMTWLGADVKNQFQDGGRRPSYINARWHCGMVRSHILATAMFLGSNIDVCCCAHCHICVDVCVVFVYSCVACVADCTNRLIRRRYLDLYRDPCVFSASLLELFWSHTPLGLGMTLKRKWTVTQRMPDLFNICLGLPVMCLILWHLNIKCTFSTAWQL